MTQHCRRVLISVAQLLKCSDLEVILKQVEVEITSVNFRSSACAEIPHKSF